MAQHQEFDDTTPNMDITSTPFKTNNAVETPSQLLPQAMPIAPSSGYTSRYDSDMEEDEMCSLGNISDDANFDDSYNISSNGTTTMNSSNCFGGSMMESWITINDDTVGDDEQATTNGDDGGDDDINKHTEEDNNASSHIIPPNKGGPRYIPPLLNYTKAISIRPSSTLYLPNLPMDTIHRLSSFLTGDELCMLSLTTKRMGERCEEVWRRVRMHTGRCLGEVMLAWAIGEHADARELATLYLQNGVPIYPAPHGHAHHTIAWRMGLEMKALLGDEGEAAATNNRNEDDNEAFDSFYTFHYNEEEETRLPSHPPYTYVEEKSVFWKTKRGIPLNESTPSAAAPASRPSSARGRTRRSTLDTVPLGAAAAIRQALRNQGEERAFRPLRRSSFSSSSPTGYTTNINSSQPTPLKSTQQQPNDPKMTLRIHRHLADQHLFNLPCIRGEVEVSPMNLHVDFFHPHIEHNTLRRPRQTSFFGPIDIDGTIRDEVDREGGEDWETLDGLPLNRDVVDWDLAGDLGLMNPHRGVAPTHHAFSNDRYGVPYISPAGDVALQMYSFSSPTVSEEKKDALTRFRVRMAVHQRKLESCVLSVRDFNDALLDWWDEVLHISAGIHFYNGQSPVPRMSHLQSFLTTPCPKALGIVQCEIERVKISSKKKFFPTYEYRLFIRDVKNDNPESLPGLPPRKDSILLVAKNKLRRRGVKNSATSNAATTNESKRGVTNYYMCLPQKRDVDSHYRSANKSHELPSGAKSGMEAAPAGVNPVLGRVQGNFIGTEFQIFSPAADRKLKTGDSSSSSEDGSDRPSSAASGRRRASVDTPSAKSKNGLARLARRATLTMNRRPSMSGFRRQSMDPAGSDDEQKNKAYRRLSFNKSSRTKRSAIANSEHKYHHEVPAVEEDEIGAITYTANLLGNRPRIMDVCVPKLNEDGNPTHAWRRSSDNDEDGESGTNSRMLSQFKSLQAAREAREQAEADGHAGQEGADTNPMDDNGLMVLQNRPPWWNVEIGAFVLNFGGRVSVASVKNFQLCERTDQDHIMLQFGRISGRHSFTMDFQYPLTPMQAFAIAISSLQSKISFG